MNYHDLAQKLETALELERPVVGLAFVDEPPAGVADAEDAPSACTFWRLAEEGVFYAAAEAHYQCPVGVMTMGFELPESEQPRAMELVGTMVELGYFGMDEVPHLPSVRKPHRGIVYGPLAEMPVQPDVVLAIVSPFQGMLLAEAAGSTALSDAPGLTAMGRPACSAIPRAMSEGGATMSLGCIGARTYAELPDDRALVVLPGEQLEATAARLDTMVKANAALRQYHAGKKAEFAER